jgi:hypothetical protein
MKLAALALAGLMAVALATDSGQDAGARGSGAVLLLYVGAEDCGSCRAWRRDHRPAFLASIDQDRVSYREVVAPRLSQAFKEPMWPANLRSFRASAERVQGVPLWLVIRDDRVIASAGGLSLWRGRVLPLVKREAYRA